MTDHYQKTLPMELSSHRRSLDAPEMLPYEAPIVKHDANAPEAAGEHAGQHSVYQHAASKDEQCHASGTGNLAEVRVRSGKICGLRLVTFWLALALAVVLVAGAVGGGVGGSLRGRSGDSSGTAMLSSTYVTSSPTSQGF